MKKRSPRPKSFLFFIAAFLIAVFFNPVSAQDPMVTDQPGFYISSHVVPQWNLQVENTFSFQKPDRGLEIYNYPRTLLRFGLLPGLELRAESALIGETRNGPFNPTFAYIFPLRAGFKTQLWKGSGIVGPVAMRFTMLFPETGGRHYNPDIVTPEFLLATQLTLTNSTKFYVNGGVTWGDFYDGPYAQYALALEQEVVKGLTLFVEPYGRFPRTGVDFYHAYDGGFMYLINNSLQVDASGGLDFYGMEQSSWFASCGLSFRLFDKKKEKVSGN